jgi:hypothetical protein
MRESPKSDELVCSVDQRGESASSAGTRRGSGTGGGISGRVAQAVAANAMMKTACRNGANELTRVASAPSRTLVQVSVSGSCGVYTDRRRKRPHTQGLKDLVRIKQRAALHHQRYSSQSADVGSRIAIHQSEIGSFARLH